MGWRAEIDPTSGTIFYINAITIVSQWELPLLPAAAFVAPASAGIEEAGNIEAAAEARTEKRENSFKKFSLIFYH